MLSEDEKKKLLARLRRIEGQTGGLIRMVEDDKYCVDVLQQISAVQGALSQTSKLLLKSRLQTCVVHAFDSKKAGERDRRDRRPLCEVHQEWTFEVRQEEDPE